MSNNSTIRRRHLILMDMGFICLSFILVGLIHFESTPNIVLLFTRHESLLWLSLLIRIPIYLSFGLYDRLWRHSSMSEVVRIAMASLLSIAFIYIINFYVLPAEGLPNSASRSVFLLDGLLNLFFLGGSRFWRRTYWSWRQQHIEQHPDRSSFNRVKGEAALEPSHGVVDQHDELAGQSDSSQKTAPVYKNLLVTGGAGFIGANFARYMLETYPGYRIVVYDKLTYAGNLDNLRGLAKTYGNRYVFVRGDICDQDMVARTMEQYQIDCIVNFAAETHVDRSLMAPGDFAQTNGYGAYVLLEQAKKFGVLRYHQISTDEVYGQTLDGSFKETDPIDCRSPYSASKASGDVMCLAYFTSFGLPVTISRGSNNIGPYQHVEKATPLFVTNALDNLPLPVYGDGLYERDYQHVRDHCEGIDTILHRGKPGEIYNLGAGQETTAIDLAKKICDLLGKPHSLIYFVEDRPGQDRRYSLDCAKVKALGWKPKHTTEQALAETIRWYVENEWWWRQVKQGEYQEYYHRQYGQRLKQAVKATMPPATALAKATA